MDVDDIVLNWNILIHRETHCRNLFLYISYHIDIYLKSFACTVEKNSNKMIQGVQYRVQ